MQGRKTTTRAFRIDETVDRQLREWAEREGVSVSFLANKALRRLVEWDMYADRFGFIAMPREALSRMIELLSEEGFESPAVGFGDRTIAYHDACHALRAQGIFREPREVLSAIPGLRVVELRNGDRCCGAAGLYNVLEPELSGELARDKVDAISESGVAVVATANPGCAMQLAASLKDAGRRVRVVHPIELLDRAYRASDAQRGRGDAPGIS